MIAEKTIPPIRRAVQEYWRGIMNRQNEREYFEQEFSRDCSIQEKASLCTLNALHIKFPLQSGFQRSGTDKVIGIGGNEPLWFLNNAGIWTPVSVVVVSDSPVDNRIVFPVKDILQSLILQLIDSLYIIAIEFGHRKLRLRMANVFDTLDCINIVEDAAVFDAKKFVGQKKTYSHDVQTQIENMVSIYRSVIRGNVLAMLNECKSFSRLCIVFAHERRTFAVDKNNQRELDIG